MHAYMHVCAFLLWLNIYTFRELYSTKHLQVEVCDAYTALKWTDKCVVCERAVCERAGILTSTSDVFVMRNILTLRHTVCFISPDINPGMLSLHPLYVKHIAVLPHPGAQPDCWIPPHSIATCLDILPASIQYWVCTGPMPVGDDVKQNNFDAFYIHFKLYG